MLSFFRGSFHYQDVCTVMPIFRMNLHQVLRVLELSGRFTCTWPQNPKSGGFKLLLNEIGWTISMLNITSLLVPLALGIYYHRQDVLVQMKTVSEFTALVEALCDLILCRMENSRLYSLITKIEEFLRVAEDREKIILQKYVDRYLTFFTFIGGSYFFTAVTFSLGPLFLAQSLPSEAWYPFPTDRPRIRFILYGMQVLGIFQTAFFICVDFTIAMLFWYPAARLEMLRRELKSVETEEQMRRCIKRHQEIIRFVDETQNSVENLIFKTNATMGCAVICGAFPLIYNPPPVVMSQFICFILAGCGRLYVTCWPADDLKQSSERVAFSVYSAQWVGKTPELMTNVLIVIRRCQKPLRISMSGLLPALSLEYYASFLTTVSSYFMTMRAVIDK